MFTRHATLMSQLHRLVPSAIAQSDAELLDRYVRQHDEAAFAMQVPAEAARLAGEWLGGAGTAKAKSWLALLLVVLGLTALGAGALTQLLPGEAPPEPKGAGDVGEPQSPAGKKTVPSEVALEAFDKLSPAERWKRVAKTTNAAKEYEGVVRGDLVKTLVARGSLESARPGNVICTVATPKGTTTVIKWLVAEGTKVKQGDLVIQLDDAGLVAQLKNQKAALDTARSELARAQDELEMVGLDIEANNLSCEIDFRTAELVLKKYQGDNVDEAAILKLQVDRAKVNIARAKVLARSRSALAQTVVDAKKTFVEAERTRVGEIEQQIQACRMVAPQDGMVVYFVPEQAKIGNSPMVIGQGEPVREGQKLIQVVDLTQMLVNVRVPEAFVSGLRDEDPKDKNGP